MGEGGGDWRSPNNKTKPANGVAINDANPLDDCINACARATFFTLTKYTALTVKTVFEMAKKTRYLMQKLSVKCVHFNHLLICFT